MSYLFENASIFDGLNDRILTDMTVHVDGNSIEYVGPARTEPIEAERIDCAGKTLMPGLIDNHVHIYVESLNLTPPEPPITYRAQYAQKYLRHTLACGFTTVRDVAGGDHGMAMALRAGFFDGPRFFYGGLCLTQTGGHGDLRTPGQPSDYLTCGAETNVLAIRADGVDQCIRAVREELRKGASHIKIMASGGVMSPSDPLERCQYSEAEIRAIVEECKRAGSYVCAHCHPPAAIRRCVEFGVRSIEHGTLIDAETADYVAEHGAYVVPTLAVLYALLDEGKEMGIPPASFDKLVRIGDRVLQGLEVMRSKKVRMGFGTDLLGNQHVRQGTEFTIRAKVLPPFEILKSATSVNAEILNLEDKLGIIAQGALADIIVVDGNPLKDISLLAQNGQKLTHIMVDGKLIKGDAKPN